ncbi:MAG: hypothetical protein B6D64_03400 [Bacteroidetes bacterium 4484_276]|nr:MAG: hypothetical protein B6D64_03400 [Bacteroidetes bacterium 4484_276]OYT13283.1 MAG: hypothetical protein B6I19_05955 [Bacteroidetes bacterium 4572_114]
MKIIIFIIILLGSFFKAYPQSREVAFTLDDRDRIMRTEERIESLRNEMNAKFEAMEQRFVGMEAKLDAMNSKFDSIYWILGIIVALILFTLGYMMWDRRTALNPIQTKTQSLDERVNKLEFVTRAQAKKDPIYAELLKQAGLL